MSGFQVTAGFAGASFVCASIGAVWDIRTRRIPNWLTAPSILCGLILHCIVGGWRSMFGAALAGVIAGGIFLVFYLTGGMGAGDVKLITAVCCLAGLQAVAEILVATALLGGLFAIILALARGRLGETFTNMGMLMRYHGSAGLHPHPDLNVANPGTLRLPYGVAIAAGAGLSFCNVWLR